MSSFDIGKEFAKFGNDTKKQMEKELKKSGLGDKTSVEDVVVGVKSYNQISDNEFEIELQVLYKLRVKQ